MATTPKLTQSEREWRAKDDARTLADAEAIKADVPRLKRAQKAARQMADEAQVKATAMSFVSKSKMVAASRVRKAGG